MKKATKALIAGSLACLAGSPATAQVTYSNDLTVNGKTYSISFDKNIWDKFRPTAEQQPWWGNESLATTFAKEQSNFTTGGPAFVYKPDDSEPRYFHSVLPKSPGATSPFKRDYNDTVNFAVAAAATPALKPIEPAGNPYGSGNGNNRSSKLGKTLAPIFKGGGLWLDTVNISEDFTLDNSADNLIDANGEQGKGRFLSGVFSDSPGQKGSIVFKTYWESITVTGKNTNTGTVTIGTGPTSKSFYLSNDGSFEEASLLKLVSGNTLNISQNTNPTGVKFKALETESGSSIVLGNNTLTTGSGNSDQTIAGSITGNGSLIKEGTEKLTLKADNQYTGNTEIKNGTLDVQGTLDDSTSVIVSPKAKYIASNNDTIQSLSGGGDVEITSGTTLTVSTKNLSSAQNNYDIQSLTGGGNFNYEMKGTSPEGLRVLGDTNLGTLNVTGENLTLRGFNRLEQASVSEGRLQLGESGEKASIINGTLSISKGTVMAGSSINANTIKAVNNSKLIFSEGQHSSQLPPAAIYKSSAKTLIVDATSSLIIGRPETISISDNGLIRGAVTAKENTSIIPNYFDYYGGYNEPVTFTSPTTNSRYLKFESTSRVDLNSVHGGASQRKASDPDVVIDRPVAINTDQFSVGRLDFDTTAKTGNGIIKITSRGVVSGVGTIQGDVINEGYVSPGNFIGTLTIDGDYYQGLTNPNATLYIEVDGSTSDLLKITGDNRKVYLGGNLKISSLPNTHITPNQIYTAIDVTGQGATGGEYQLKTDLSGVVGSSGYLFARETSPAFARLDQPYFDTCTSSDPNIQKNCTKLQFAWLQIAKDPNASKGTKQVATPTGTVQVITPNTQSPTTVINQVKQTGGAITTASSGDSNTNTDTCTANTGNAAACQQQNKSGSGKNGSNANNTQVAKVIDAGQASLGVVVTNGTTGGDPVTVNGVNSGYTTNQTKQAKVTPDFVSVYNALFSIPNRQDLNQALHSISAEPYASMQSVALEAIEQFGKNSLALTDRAIPLTHTQTFCKTDDGNLIPADSPQRPDTCDEREKTVGSRWSLLIDGSNTEASLNGTSELASFDYNVFSTIYGLQYAFSPQWSVGAAFGYGQANLTNYEYANSHINSDTYSGSIWGIYRPSPEWKISGLLGTMSLQYDSNRNMNFGGLNRTAEADWDGSAFLSTLEAQYNWALNGNNSDPDAIRLKPRTFLSYAVHNQGSFTESGAQSLNLAIDSHTADSVLWGLELTLETPIRLSSSNRIIPRFTVGYEHDFMGSADEEHQLSSSFSDMPGLGSVDVLGQNRGADALDLGLSIEIETADSVSLYAGVNGGFWSNGNEISYGGGLKYSW